MEIFLETILSMEFSQKATPKYVLHQRKWNMQTNTDFSTNFIFFAITSNHANSVG